MNQREPRRVSIDAPSIGGAGQVWAYGHYGRPVLAFPSQQGEVWDFGNNGMVDAIGWLIDEGRIKLYCVESFDGASWFDDSIPFEERAHRHNAYVGWIYDRVAPAIAGDAGGRQDIIATGCSFGAYHAVNATLQRPDFFPIGLGLSGVYDIRTIGAWGEQGQAVYFANPVDYVANLHGDHLDWLRGNSHPVLVVGQGQWEDTTGALESTTSFGQLCRDKGLNVEVDLWGHDIPHDWPSWRRMLAHHLPRFC
ncbi:esterase family protein [Euzebya tangerina]|uniref:esterase family protein n=1 Tax=Euzebya tangerina TaxID=591198 RepID=UPI000E32365A|nr:esterase [Euzebya tangerina]